MADDIQPDQETYDRLIAAGESERTARAKAKSVAIRKERGANRASLQGDGQAAAPAAATEAAPAAVATEAAPAAAGASAAACPSPCWSEARLAPLALRIATDLALALAVRSDSPAAISRS